MNVPDGDFEPFVLAYDIDTANKRFRYIITTKTLMVNATVLSAHLCADATYKVNYQEFPLILIGSTDKHNKYHCFAMAVVTDEKQDTYEFVFRKFKEGMEKKFSIKYDPQTLLADGAMQIRNAFTTVFGSDKLLSICFFHVKTNCEKRLKEDVKEDIKDDITNIHKVTDSSLFSKAVEIFENKWKDKEPVFVDYFHKQWVESMPGWYLGFSPGTPTSNNGTEAKNGTVKKYYTKYLKLGLLEANNTFLEMIKQWSAVYANPAINTIVGNITRQLKKEAYAFASSKKFGKCVANAGKLHFYVGQKNYNSKIRSMEDLRKQHQHIHTQFPGLLSRL